VEWRLVLALPGDEEALTRAAPYHNVEQRDPLQSRAGPLPPFCHRLSGQMRAKSPTQQVL